MIVIVVLVIIAVVATAIGYIIEWMVLHLGLVAAVVAIGFGVRWLWLRLRSRYLDWRQQQDLAAEARQHLAEERASHAERLCEEDEQHERRRLEIRTTLADLRRAAEQIIRNRSK